MTNFTKVEDALGGAISLLHAIERMAEAICRQDAEDYCALNYLASTAKSEIAAALYHLDEMRLAVDNGDN